MVQVTTESSKIKHNIIEKQQEYAKNTNKILNEDINHFYDDTWNKKILEEKKSKRQTKDFTGSLKIMQIYI